VGIPVSVKPRAFLFGRTGLLKQYGQRRFGQKFHNPPVSLLGGNIAAGKIQRRLCAISLSREIQKTPLSAGEDRIPVWIVKRTFQFILGKALTEHFPGCRKFRQRLTQAMIVRPRSNKDLRNSRTEEIAGPSPPA